jgi:hypothetical protein
MSNHKQTAMVIALGLVAVLMISASTFPRMAYASFNFPPPYGLPLSKLQNEEKQLQQQIQAEVQKDILGNANPKDP